MKSISPPAGQSSASGHSSATECQAGTDIVERALVHEGRKHYFLVEFPQEPGQLRRFLDEILGPDDDITLFEYLKRNNRETGAALVGIQLSRAEDLAGLKERMAESKISVQHLQPNTPEYDFLVA